MSGRSGDGRDQLGMKKSPPKLELGLELSLAICGLSGYCYTLYNCQFKFCIPFYGQLPEGAHTLSFILVLQNLQKYEIQGGPKKQNKYENQKLPPFLWKFGLYREENSTRLPLFDLNPARSRQVNFAREYTQKYKGNNGILEFLILFKNMFLHKDFGYLRSMEKVTHRQSICE